MRKYRMLRDMVAIFGGMTMARMLDVGQAEGMASLDRILLAVALGVLVMLPMELCIGHFEEREAR